MLDVGDGVAVRLDDRSEHFVASSYPLFCLCNSVDTLCQRLQILFRSKACAAVVVNNVLDFVALGYCNADRWAIRSPARTAITHESIAIFELEEVDALDLRNKCVDIGLCRRASMRSRHGDVRDAIEIDCPVVVDIDFVDGAKSVTASPFHLHLGDFLLYQDRLKAGCHLISSRFRRLPGRFVDLPVTPEQKNERAGEKQ